MVDWLIGEAVMEDDDEYLEVDLGRLSVASMLCLSVLPSFFLSAFPVRLSSWMMLLEGLVLASMDVMILSWLRASSRCYLLDGHSCYCFSCKWQKDYFSAEWMRDSWKKRVKGFQYSSST